MTNKPMTKADIQALGCPDCIADIHVVPSVSGITGKRVPVVTVRHAPTCPWARRYIGVNPVTIAASMGILIHHRGIDDDLDTPPSTEPTTAPATEAAPSTPDKTSMAPDDEDPAAPPARP